MKKKQQKNVIMVGYCPDLKTASREGEDNEQIRDLQSENAVSLSYISSVQVIMNARCHSENLEPFEIVSIALSISFVLSRTFALPPPHA